MSQQLTYKEQMEFGVFEPIVDPYYQKKMENDTPISEESKQGYFYKKMQNHLQSQERKK